MDKKKERDCKTGGWGISKPTKSKRSLPPIWPGVYLWLLVGVIIIITKLF